ncbi:Ger(x)C family spore germination protein [Neobacillus sp. K501]
MRISKIGKLYLICSMVFTLSGCWDNKDINHRTIPVVLGVSKKEKDYTVYLQIPIPLKETIKTKIIIGKGKTVNQAIDNISRDEESTVDLLHVKVILIENNLAKQGVKDLISGFMRSRDVSPRALTAIVEGDFEQFFKKMEKNEEFGGTNLLDCFEKSAGWSPQIAITRIWELYRSIHSYTHDVPIPLFTIGKTTMVEQLGSAVIKNGKMVGKISPDETLLYNAFKGESVNGKIEVMDAASVMILSNHLDHESRFVKGKPQLSSTLRLKVMVLETNKNPSTDIIKKQTTSLLRNRFQEMHKHLQEEQADIIGIGQYFRQILPRDRLKYWRSQYFPDLIMDFQVHVDIQNSGNLKIPFK